MAFHGLIAEHNARAVHFIKTMCKAVLAFTLKI